MKKRAHNLDILFLYILLLVVPMSCTYKSDAYMDNGNWEKFTKEDPEKINFYVFYQGKIWAAMVEPLSLLSEFGTIKEADVETFEVCKVWQNSNYWSYAKDKNHVYYPIETNCFDGDDGGGEFAVKYIVKSARPELFKYLGFGYAIAGNHMYHCGKEIEWDEEIIRKLAKPKN